MDFLKRLCGQVFPEFEYRGHTLDHERDLFVMTLEAPDGRRKTIGWTRMVLFDQERLPALLEDPSSPLAARLQKYLGEHGARSEIVVTFRHLEEGWIDTPEPRREKRRRRRGRHPEKRDGRLPQPRGESSQPTGSRRPLPGPAFRAQAPSPAQQPAPPSASGATAGEGRRRRRRFRRRRGRGGGSPAGPGSPHPAPGKTP